MKIIPADFTGVRVDNSCCDYPTAWRIVKASRPSDHHARCSYRTHSLLCDCYILKKHPAYTGTHPQPEGFHESQNKE